MVLCSVQDISLWLDRVRLIGKVSLEWNRPIGVACSDVNLKFFKKKAYEG